MLKKIIIIFIFISTFASIFAGWHPALSVIPGTFPQGNFIFNGSIKIGTDASSNSEL